jgi:cytochrome c oxidase assembly protein subunit 11
MSDTEHKHKGKRRDGAVALALVGLVAGMTGLAFASVPLYRMFCQATGYGGVPQRAERGANEIFDRTIRIRFDANIDHALPWTFVPVQRVIDVKIGETALAFFKASNTSNAQVSGTAVFNVVPELAGRYFTKIECFCFKQQTLAPGETRRMPVTFVVDPKLPAGVTSIALSYTFFEVAGRGGKS